MILKFGYAFLTIALLCIIVQSSAIAPFIAGIVLIAYHNWRQSAYTDVGTRKINK